jgi:protein phosphatase-4 regulatory subunit 3
MRPSGKRRRDEEEDGLLERLSKTKKVDFGEQKGGPGRIGGTTKRGDDPPKKMKLKFGAASLAVVSPSPSTVPSDPGAKDGDTG